MDNSKNLLLSNKAFILVLIGQGASGLGNTFAIFLMSWLLYDLTGSIFAMGTLWFVYVFSMIICHIVSGPFLDRYNKKYVLIFSEWTKALIFVLPLLCLYFNILTIEILYLVVVLVGLVEPLFRPASLAYIVNIVREKELVKANSVLETIVQTMMIAGPAIGGILLGFFSPIYVIAFLIVVLSLAGILLSYLPGEQIEKNNIQPKQSWLKDFSEGIQFFIKNKLFLWIAGLIFFVNLGAGATQPMLLPYVLEYLGGDSFQYGLISSGVAIGMLVGAVTISTVNKFKNIKAVMLGTLMLSGVSLFLLGFTNTFLLSLFFIILFGFFVVIFNINNTMLYQANVPQAIRGRVFIARGLLARVGIPIGAISGGFLGEAIGINFLFNLIGVIIVIPCTIAWFIPSFNKLKDYKVKNVS
ncbi:MFS transporter [Halalkalibacterium halodurans]|uniref:MFS transporter n=1 Tax=Halalkalibacterium halodurans TaxID=86665 RepID=UPI002E1AC6BE|nr:MFS transporter [Halalkalibacterium halodurans]